MTALRSSELTRIKFGEKNKIFLTTEYRFIDPTQIFIKKGFCLPPTEAQITPEHHPSLFSTKIMRNKKLFKKL